jgi:pimeloyl-ACP methyl ester carboxylesterase
VSPNAGSEGGAGHFLGATVEVMSDTAVMVLPDTRELAWLEVGDPKGPAVFVFHGTPGSRLQVSFDQEKINAAGVRFIAVDRPGYGHSSYQRGRRLADWASDVSSLADHLNIDRFSVVGVSGGGPHAAVCARFLGNRVLGAGIVSGVGSLAEPGAEDGMMGFNKLIVRCARRSEYLVYPPFALSAAAFRRWPEKALRAGSGQLPASDLEVLRRPEVKMAFIEDYRRSSSTTPLAAAQDFALFCRDWGFRLEDITVPVNIWHGDEDRNIPLSHGRLQAERIPGARLHECSGEGHMLVVDHFEEILRTVSKGIRG